MKHRYCMFDTIRGEHCGRFTSLDRAMRDINAAIGAPGRFTLLDRLTGETIAKSGGSR